MTLSTNSKKVIAGLLVAFPLFLGLKWVFERKSKGNEKAPSVNASPEDIQTAATAYADACLAGEPQSVLNDINTELATEYNIQVYQRKSDGAYIVTDMSGTEIQKFANL